MKKFTHVLVHAMVVGIGVGIGIGIEWPLRFDDARKQTFLIDTEADTNPDNEHTNLECNDVELCQTA